MWMIASLQPLPCSSRGWFKRASWRFDLLPKVVLALLHRHYRRHGILHFVHGSGGLKESFYYPGNERKDDNKPERNQSERMRRERENTMDSGCCGEKAERGGDEKKICCWNMNGERLQSGGGHRIAILLTTLRRGEVRE